MQMCHIPTVTLEDTENNKWCNRHVSIDECVHTGNQQLARTCLGVSVYTQYLHKCPLFPNKQFVLWEFLYWCRSNTWKWPDPVSRPTLDSTSPHYDVIFLATLLFNLLQPFHWALEKYRLLWIWTLRDHAAMIAPWQNSIKSTDATQLAQRAHAIITQTKSGPIKGSSLCHSVWMEWIFCFFRNRPP